LEERVAHTDPAMLIGIKTKVLKISRIQKTKVIAAAFKNKMFQGGNRAPTFARICWKRMPGPPLGWRLCGVVGWGRAILCFYSGLQLAHFIPHRAFRCLWRRSLFCVIETPRAVMKVTANLDLTR